MYDFLWHDNTCALKKRENLTCDHVQYSTCVPRHDAASTAGSKRTSTIGSMSAEAYAAIAAALVMKPRGFKGALACCITKRHSVTCAMITFHAPSSRGIYVVPAQCALANIFLYTYTIFLYTAHFPAYYDASENSCVRTVMSGWLVARGLCKCMLVSFSAVLVWMLPVTLL